VHALVTGATGLLGNALVNRLVDGGWEISALVRDERRARGVVPEAVTTVRADITDPASLPSAFRDVEVVFHTAGVQHGRLRDLSVFDRVNRGGSANVFAAALEAGVRRVVYTSATDVFRKGADGSLHEENLDPQFKRTDYGRSMQAAAQVAEAALDRGVDVVHMNPGAMFGPSPYQAGLNAYLVDLLKGKVPMLMPGGFSVAYVDAVAQAHVVAAERGAPGERYLLADAYLTMAEFAERAVEVAGVGKVPRTAPAWLLKPIDAVSTSLTRTVGLPPALPVGVLSLLLWQARIDASKAKRELHYEPTPLEDGLAAAVAHLRELALIPGRA
jgi:dihydroflavonol-4-reductase